MKEELLKIINEFLENVGKELLKQNNDIGYFNYCLGQRDILQKMKVIVNNNEISIALNEIKELQKGAKEKIDTDNREFYVGSVNVVNYVLAQYIQGGN